MKTNILLLPCIFLACLSINAQQLLLSGQTLENDGRGTLRNVKIVVLEIETNEVMGDTITDRKGAFSLRVPADKTFKVIADKNHFFQRMDTVSTVGMTAETPVTVNIEMERKPGFVFDVTIAEAKLGMTTEGPDGIKGARIEVYNNTTMKTELALNNYPNANFKFTFENGNHYTMMIRRKGYFNKRIEAYVNVEGCIMCFDGLGLVEPGVTDVLSNNNTIGTFLANVDLQPLELNRRYEIENIYYDYNKANIRPDAAKRLDGLVGILKDNPGVAVELGSHTDARGRDAYNMSLSEKRAEAAVQYLLDNAKLSRGQLSAKGYGESNLVNGCTSQATCNEDQHQKNRRTELKIVGIAKEDPLDKKTLEDIILGELDLGAGDKTVGFE